VLVDDALDDRQPQPGAAELLDSIVGAVELVEDVGLVVGRDADPAIAHGEQHELAARAEAHANPPAIGRVFDRILQQVIDQLAQAQRIAGHRRQRIRHDYPQIVVLALPLVAQSLNRVAHDQVHGDRLGVAVEAGFDLAQLQQVVDQRGDRLHAEDDPLDELALSLVQRAGPVEQLHVAEDSGQRRAQIM